jgi:iturin family lipopeptide synthetase A
MKKDFFGSGNSNSQSRQGASSISVEKLSKNDIAIIGMAGRLPLAENLDQFWKNLETGSDCVINFPQQRVDEVTRYMDFKKIPYTAKDLTFKRKGFLSDIDKFDYKFFRITQKEASVMNPAQRIFLQEAYHAIENAGYSCEKLKGSQTGIFMGYTGGSDDYLDLVKEVEPAFGVMAYPANLSSIIASRVSYMFDFKGPSLLIDTACSSSMVAFNLACQSLRDGTCETAIAGGINLSWVPLEENGNGLGILSLSGKTRTFDNHSDGTVGGEGCIAMLLKPLNKAIRDNDHIHAVVKGVAFNQDGASIGITAPNAIAQADVIEKAWKDAKVNPESITYIEAHGTGTALGDPIEIEGITQAFRRYTDKKQFCAISAVKTNVGHLNSVAGIAGITKATLSLSHKKIPALLHFERPNNKINFEESPVYVNTQLSNWESDPGIPRKCGVSSFGMSGTNCHVVLEEAPPVKQGKQLMAKYLFTLSAQTSKAVGLLVNDYIQMLETLPAEVNIEDICYTATAGRDHHELRYIFEVSSSQDLKAQLLSLLNTNPGEPMPGNIRYSDSSKKTPPAHLKKQADEVMQNFSANTQKTCAGEFDALFKCIIQLYLEGGAVAWEKLFAGSNPRRVILPLYPFEQKRCWVTYPEPVSDEYSNPSLNTSTSTKKYEEMQSNMPGSTFLNEQAAFAVTEKESSAGIREMINLQIQLMAKQLEILGGAGAETMEEDARQNTFQVDQAVAGATGVVLPAEQNETDKKEQCVPQITGVQAVQVITDIESNVLEYQQKYVSDFIRDFNIKTKKSKAFAQENRAHYANNRHVAGYNKAYKEIMYPIIVDEAHGAEISDIDGNKYVDFCMGFGVYLLGYSHPAVMNAVKEQADKGSYLGPMSALPGEVAKLICEMTGVERVAFYNSGTEAVMLALRLARAATSKTKIVMFSGSYHGTYDGVLGQADRFSKAFKAVPKSTGIPQSILDEVILLDYGTDESLEIIRKNAHELAGVLVEPVQSRRPEFQPAAYLLELRKLTEELKIPLIFDEIITGFRIHPGGAQAWFGIKADLVTYGKIPGGGMPVGIIAGKAEFMHGVDGGLWQFGDDSHPKFDHRKTFVAGTFCHHPITMASAKAALQHLKQQGPALQENLNSRTAAMTAELNDFFEQEQFDVKIVNFGSLFQIRTNYNLSLIVYHFLNQGIYAWEGMTFFISTAHTDEHISFLIDVFKKTLEKLRTEGFIPGRHQRLPAPEPAADLIPGITKIPLTDEQRRLWFIAAADANASAAFNSARLVSVEEEWNETAFNTAIAALVNRHEILRTVSIDGDHLHIAEKMQYKVFTQTIEENEIQSIAGLVKKEKSILFNFSKGPFFRITIFKIKGGKFVMALVVHHLVADGWSVNVLLEEIAALYQDACKGTASNLPPAVPFSNYLEWIDAQYTDAANGEARNYWINQLSHTLPAAGLPGLALKDSNNISSGNSFVLKLDEDMAAMLEKMARKEGCTVFMVFLSLYNLFASKIFINKQQVIGIPSAGQLNMEAPCMVGCCIQMLPFFTDIDDELSFSAFLAAIKNNWLKAYRYRKFPYLHLGREAGCSLPELTVTFNMDAPVSIQSGDPENEKGTLYQKNADLNKYHLFLNVAKVNKQYKLTFQYNNALFDDSLMEIWIRGFETLLTSVTADTSLKIRHIGLQNNQPSTYQSSNLPQVNTDVLNAFLNNQPAKDNDAVVLEFSGNQLTYSGLSKRAAEIALALQGVGVKKGSVTGIALHNKAEILCAVLGVLKTGSAYVLLQDDATVPVDAVITAEPVIEKFYNSTALVIDINALQPEQTGISSSVADVKFCADDVVKITISNEGDETQQYQQQSCGAVLAYFESLKLHFNLNEAGIVTVVDQELSADVLTDLMLMCVLSGMQVRFVTAPREQMDILTSPPAANTLVLHKSVLTEHSRNINTGGEKISPELNLFVINDSLLLAEEVQQWFSCRGNGSGKYQVGFYSPRINKIISHLEITDTVNLPVVLAAGYMLEPGKYTMATPESGQLATGIFGNLFYNEQQVQPVLVLEHCRFIANGQLELNFLTDEKRHIALLEGIAACCKRVKNCRVVKKDGTVKNFTLYVSFHSNSNSNVFELQKMYRKYFLPGFLPTEFVIDAEGEIGDTTGNSVNLGMLMPVSAGIEQQLLSIFKSVLKQDGIGVNDNFFDWGGNSLRAIQIISKMHRELNVKLPLKKLFTHSTVAELAVIAQQAGQDIYTSIEPAPLQQFYPVSHAQKRLWIIDQMEKRQTAYLINSALMLEGDLSTEYFKEAVYLLIKRHESLRTNIVLVEGEPKQFINEVDTVDRFFTFIDISEQPGAADSVKEMLGAAASTPVDLSTDPLLRILLIKTGPRLFALSITLHHIIADGWSMEIFMNDLTGLYNACKNNSHASLAPLSIQYKDFAIWQNKLLEGDGIDMHRQFWSTQLGGEIPVIDLPEDFSRPVVKTTNGSIVYFDFESQLSDKIFAISKMYGTSTFTTLLALVNILLHKYSGQSDIIIGSTTAGRDQAELENQIGIFANTLVFRSQFNAGESFEKLLSTVKSVTLNAYEHQVYPFDKIVDDLNISRDKSRSPLYDVMIELDDIDVELELAEAIEDLKFSHFDKVKISSNYDLTFRFNAEKTIFGGIEFNTDLFLQSTIEKMVAHLKQIIFAVDADIKLPLCKLPYLSAAEQQQLLVEFNTTGSTIPSVVTFQEQFEKTVEQFGDGTAVVCGGTQMTYASLNEKVNALAYYLKNNYQVSPDDKIGLMADRSERVIIALLAILKTGASFVPISPDLPADRINFIIEDAAIKLVLTDSDFMFDLADNASISLFVLDIELDGIPEHTGNIPVTASENDLAYIIYTSGSTGNPKGVEIERHSLAHYSNWANEYYFSNRPGKTFAFFTSLSFDLTITCIFSTLLRGDSVVVYDEKDVPTVLRKIFNKNSGIDVVKMTPAHINLLQYIEIGQTEVSQVIAGGEKLTNAQVHLLKQLNPGIKVYNEYGPTEATVGCIVKEVNAEDVPVMIGKPIINTQVYILGENMELLPPRVWGELYIGGDGLARGYANNEKLTGEKFITNPFTNDRMYKTGDVARWHSNGEIEYLGRNDDQVKINGYRIELSEIESTLLSLESINEAVVTVITDSVKNSVLASFFVADMEIKADVIAGHLRNRLPQYMIPAFFIQLDSMPITTNGKINKKALPDPLSSDRFRSGEYLAPQSDVQQRIAYIWQRVFSMEKVGIRDNFFEIGGHSLKATQIILELFKEFGVNVPLDDVFLHPTIEALAARIATTEKSVYSEILPVKEQAYYDVSHAQNRIWILNLLDEVQTAYIIPEVFQLEGELDLEAFIKAFDTLVMRHESLRTNFVLIDGVLKQQIHAFEDFAFSVEYSDQLKNKDAWEIVKTAVASERNTSFDLEKGPLIKASLIRVEQAKYVFLLTMHHIISDGWSFEVLIKEVSQLYGIFSEGKANTLQPLAIQNKDYAAWQLENMQGEKLQQHKDFWSGYLGGDVPMIEVPTDYPRGLTRTYNGDTVKFSLDQALTNKIKQLSQDNACSVFMTLVTVIDLLLYRHTREKDITIGFPIAGRNHKDLENQIGFYLNTLALRVKLDTAETVSSLIQKVKKASLDVFKYQLYSFDLIIEDLNIERKPNRSPLFDVGITWQNQMAMNISDSVEFRDITITQLEEDCVIAKHDLWFYGSEMNGCIGFRLRYNTDLYEKETIEKLRMDFLKICETISGNPEISVSELVASITDNYNSKKNLLAITSCISENF